MNMIRVAIVVQRCHKSVVGGSEAHAWQYANLLKDAYCIDVLTTTAVDSTTWANVLPDGEERQDGIAIRRFSVTIGRGKYWNMLHGRLLNDLNSPSKLDKRHRRPISHLYWSLAFQEDYIRHQGPYSEPLLKYLREKWSSYKAIIFLTYLYPTTYFGIQQVPKSRSLLVPTLHDEPPAYLPAYRYMANCARKLLWNTEAERSLGDDLWERLPNRIVSMGVETKAYTPADFEWPYILYCGRIDAGKGCDLLIQHFIKFKSEYPSDLRLILTGKDELGIPSRPDIEYRGFVSTKEKFELMAGATVFVMPSPYESLSIVSLEAMAQCTPVLANGACKVLVDHVMKSGGGMIYKDYENFASLLNRLLSDPKRLSEMGSLGREYIVSTYQFDVVRNALIEEIEGYE